MDCLLCLEATKRWHGIFNSDCCGCMAREISRGPDYARVRNVGKLDGDYRDLLAHAGVTHDDVKAAAAVDKALREVV
jgi:hypothetical protein